MKKVIAAKFMKQKIVTLAEISELLDCSIHTAKPHVKKLGAVTSINHNAKYYSLPQIINFDENGLWEYKKVRFSKYGTLKATIIALVNNSDAGMNATEISELLAVAPHTLLAAMADKRELMRSKHARSFVYFSIDEELHNVQLQKRKEMNEQRSADLIPDAIGVLVLVEFIQNPELSLEKLTNRLNHKGAKITESLLHDFLGYHGLLKKR